VFDNESVGLVASLYFDETERVLLLLLLGVMADLPILVPQKMLKPEDLHHHALEQLPNLAYCINDNPRWGKEVMIRSW